MKIVILKERKPNETRVAVSPQVCSQWIKSGISVAIETDAGNSAGFANQMYESIGASVAHFDSILDDAEVFIGIHAPTTEVIEKLPSSCVWISTLYHLTQPETIAKLNSKNISAISLDAIPRISRAQSMDVLSSQANLAGYKAVINGAYHLNRIFPLLMTAAGTVTPSKVLIFGAGVAGLQAIATAKRLGAVVEATDVRPETKEQVESLGGKFIEVKDVSVESEGGYAKEATEEYRQKQREAVNKSLANADLIITTALVPGKKAPILIDDEQLELLKPGSIVVDMAAEQGGNTTQTKPNEIILYKNTKIVGAINLAGELATNASELLARNIAELLKLIAPKNSIHLNLDDEIIVGCLICHEGKIRLGQNATV